MYEIDKLKNVIIVLVLVYGSLISITEAKIVIINHDLTVQYEPETHVLIVSDNITIPSSNFTAALQFSLHSDLTIESLDPAVTITKIEVGASGIDNGMDQEKFEGVAPVPVTRYTIRLEKSLRSKERASFVINYKGKIFHPIKQQGEEYSRGFSQSPGLIAKKGVYLSGSSYWIPTFADEFVTYQLKTSSPKGWKVVSQGNREISVDKNGRHIDQWLVNIPSEEIYLIGAKFSEYSFDMGSVKAMAFLRSDDEALANKYLETTAQYTEMYRNLIGPYPYSKFALVENFWETGYGMPSFTLLGEQIIRFPFILHSSYPHELLHNWWGNSVYIDFEQGNWCEG
ncbi:MAG: hypothetical protein L3J46_07615, partial [Kangiellaceae bacterium]|nr:hypothetical protein [Kangiellaceae bacterium]